MAPGRVLSFLYHCFYLLPCSKTVKLCLQLFVASTKAAASAHRSSATLPLHDGGDGARFGDAFAGATTPSLAYYPIGSIDDLQLFLVLVSPVLQWVKDIDS